MSTSVAHGFSMTDLTAFGLPADLPDIAAPDYLGAMPPPEGVVLTRRQKAAIIVRVLLSDGSTLSLADLPPGMQVALTREISALRQVDQDTLSRVVDEFIEELEGGGLSFSGGLQEALSILEGSISPETARRLSREEGITLVSDPWKRLVEFPAEKLAPLAGRESVEVAAILLSKLSTEKSAEVLGLMSGDKARRAAYAVSQTAQVGPETVRTIGRALLAQLDAEPRRAFASKPFERIGAILTSSKSAVREGVMQGLTETDADFADAVRKTIFTFRNISERIAPRDVPRIAREIDPGILTQALKYAAHLGGDDAASGEFLLDAMSKRMAESIREDLGAMPAIRQKSGEAAQDAVVAAIRKLIEIGDIAYRPEDEES